ncbi:MAG: TlpA family protein disulfide reductase [Clostridia bacterium]|nr:TlpA family protein disulfide reductase [Clostridia bacterium]
MKKTLLALILALSLLLCAASSAESASVGPRSRLGKAMPEFHAETITGETFTLSEALKTHKAVLVNFWATWCWPCELEFPYMQQAYEQYQDEVAIIALSVDKDDTKDMLIEYAASHGLTFGVASDSKTYLSALFVDEGIPTSVLVDRFGNIVLIEVGAQFSADPFLNAFALLTDDAYTQTVVLDGFPETPPEAAKDAAITVRFVDQSGKSVPGCIVNFCTDSACTPVFADENGVAVYALDGKADTYHLQVIRIPGGYEFDTSQEFTVQAVGQEIVFTLTNKTVE